NFRIDGQEPRQERQRIERLILALAEQQIGDWSNKNGTRMEAQCLRFTELVDWLGRGQGEVLAARELGHHIVVVGVEPFGHLERWQVAVGSAPRAARPREIGVERYL